MKTILLIDDSPDFLEMIKYVLTQAGYRVVTALDGKQGVIQARNAHPDLILMDMKMPGHSGVETAEYLKSIGKFSGIPVVFLTGVVAEDRPEGGATVSVDGQEYDMIPKTVDRLELLRRIKVYLAGGTRKWIKVLLVEDSPTDTMAIKRALEKSARQNFEVSEAKNLGDAQKWLQHHVVDVLVLDLGLPDSPKQDTLLWMLKQELPIVVMTGDEDEVNVADAFRHGAQDYLVKGDFSEREAARCVMYALERAVVNRELLLYKKNLDRIVQDRVKELLDAERKRSA